MIQLEFKSYDWFLEKPLKVKDRAVAKTEDVPLAVVPVPLPAAASMKEPDIVSAEPNCQELPCQVQQGDVRSVEAMSLKT